jgi:16S rRNA (guanine527-N7)-methyltransferase
MLLRDFESILRDEANALGIELAPDQLDLARRHAEELLAWNARVNLTRITDPVGIARRHFVEAFLAARLLPPPLATGQRAVTLVDLGSGAGFPGLALRVVRPDAEVTLVEPRARRAAFLARVAVLYPRPAPQVLVATAQDVATRGLRWDVVSMRAVRMSAQVLCGLIRGGGRLLLFPSAGEPGGGGPVPSRTDLERAGLWLAGYEALPDQGRRVEAWESAPPE